ncbi:MAG: hypothetical protein HY548_03480 [Elusimicrobia bacterium]|nr:hypothetical protein [Elusimicrobiota bacterium]
MAYSVSSTIGPLDVSAGKYRMITKKVSPDAATGSVTFSEVTTVDSIVGFGFLENLTANCYTMQASINGSTANQVDFALWKAGGTAADTAYLDFWITVLGY